MKRWPVCGALLALTALRSLAAQTAPADHCMHPGADQPAADLYCLELVAAPALDPRVRAYAILDLAPGPFTLPVTQDGQIRYRPRLAIPDLAAVRAAAPANSALVVWATTPVFGRWRRIGLVQGAMTLLDEVAWDQFVLLVSAEVSDSVTERAGPVLLRGRSPSTRMTPPDFVELASGVIPLPASAFQGGGHIHAGDGDWPVVPMPAGFAMLPAEMALRPDQTPWLPTPDGVLPRAEPSRLVRLHDGDSLVLIADEVQKRIHGRGAVMYAFNRQIPGPMLWVQRGATVTIDFENRLELPSTVHWHGVRLDAAMDGTPHVSQDPVPPGGSFRYTVRFPDAGLYWYHPHVREDIQQDLGLSGNIAVRGMAGLPPVAREEVVMLDDLLVGDDGLIPYGTDAPTHALMGRFGNLFLVNGEPRATWVGHPGETIRFWFTNAASTRTFNLSVTHATLRLVASDLGPFQRVTPVESVVIAPAERYAVDVTLDATGGPYLLANRVRALDHLMAQFRTQVDTLGTIVATPGAAASPIEPLIAVTGEREPAAALPADLTPDLTFEFGLALEAQPFITTRMMQLDSSYFHPIEWSGTMPMMNWATTGTTAHWFIRNVATGGVDADAHFIVQLGDRRIIRLVNRRTALHAMQHPIHIHGQRFRILAVNGVPPTTWAWKDTVLLPAGATVDILVEFTNPGRWMLHCHIAEHVESGMMTTFTVEE